MTVLEEFIERYGPQAGADGPVLFVREVLGAEPDEWQEAALRAYGGGERKISIQSCHGPGKTCLLAWIIWHQLLTRFPQKTACTAPTAKQLYDALFAEVKSWFLKLPAPIRALFEIKSDRIELVAARADSFVTFTTARAEQPEALQGIHSTWVLLIADEASGVPEPIFEAAGGSMSSVYATTILAGNPVRTTGYFADSQTKASELWRCFQISAVARPGAYISHRIAPQFIEEMKLAYGEDSNAFRVRVLGLAPRGDLDTIIPYELIAAASGRDVSAAPGAAIAWGLDVARFGDCLTALAKRQANVLLEPVRTWSELDTMQVVGVTKAEYDSTPKHMRPTDICVDAIGLGAGVADRLRELGLPARAINVSEVPSLVGPRFVNLRTELWWKARDWFSQRNCHLPPEPKMSEDRSSLQAELARIKYKIIDSSGKLRAESKDDMRKRGFRSPDKADAFVLTFASTAASALFGGNGKGWNQPLKRNVKGIV